MRNQQLIEMLKEQLDHEERETEAFARKVRETKNSVVKLLYTKLMRDSMQHADVLNGAIAYLVSDRWEASVPVVETRDEMIRLMDLEEKALRFFAAASMKVNDRHLKNLLTMLASDEEQHYAMLRYVLENFVKEEAVEA